MRHRSSNADQSAWLSKPLLPESAIAPLIDGLQEGTGVFSRTNPLAKKQKSIRTRYQELMYTLTGLFFGSPSGRIQCKQFETHRNCLKRSLGRDPGMQVAALDYLVNIAPQRDNEFVIIGGQQLQHLLENSSFDSVTGLYNRLTFESVMEKELALAERNRKTFVLLIADLDNFKHVNDSEGHQRGDWVLTQVASVFRDNLRAMDIAGRYGGDEFLVGLPDTTIESALEISERIRCKIMQLFSANTGTTISMGLAAFPQAGRTSTTLLAAADTALYNAKSSGRNQLKCAPCNIG